MLYLKFMKKIYDLRPHCGDPSWIWNLLFKCKSHENKAPKLVITVPADSLAPNGARLSAGIGMTTKLDIFLVRFFRLFTSSSFDFPPLHWEPCLPLLLLTSLHFIGNHVDWNWLGSSIVWWRDEEPFQSGNVPLTVNPHCAGAGFVIRGAD